MAFGGGSGFSFGSNNNSTSTFGGFGSNNTTSNTGAFGSTSTSGGFGTTSTTTNPFGGGGGGGGFGSNSGGFGNSTNSGGGLFGNKPASAGLFGSNNTSTGGLFGSTNNNASTGFGSSTTGGFGASTNNNNAFGSNNNSGFGGGAFGNTANKPAFGSGSGSTLFGQGGAGTTGGFGSSGNAFGGSGTALGQNVPPSQGTAIVPFAPTAEKDPNGTMQNFQSINFMEPYQKYSFEELRLADYNAGRQFGNGTGQPAGGFGSSSTFGGFGSNNTTGGFGSNNQTNNPFGSNTSTSGGFGANTSSTFGGASGGLFGQNKPATGGLFGQQSSSTTGGGLFGTSNNNTSSNPFSTNNTSTGFGSNNATSGGLFGNSNNNQSKPGGLFGNTGTSSTGGGFSFGSNNNQQQSSTTGGGLFGNNNQQQQSTGGGLFGNNNNSQQQNKPGGLFGNSTGGAFGSNTTGQTSGGLFGTSTNTNTSGGGLFGNNNASTTGTTGGLFGNSSNAASSNTGGGLFGNNSAANQSKPGGLFGNSTFGNNQQQSTGGGLFGNTQQQSSTGGGLFGNNNNNATSTGGFSFNNNQNKPAGGLFGTSSNNQSGGLFGNSTGGGNSLFANSMNQSQQAQQQQSDVKHASLLDSNPYGQSSIWTGLPAPTEQNSQPLVTALTATQKLKESQAKPPPNLRLNQSRYMTPPRRGGYGFSYSTYGTPSSAASTPGGNSLSTSMYGSRFTGGSFGRSMGKAASVSNMRSYYNEGESVLAPGAFTPSSSRYSSGSIRRLTIDRSIRDDLFSPRPALPAPTANSAQPTPSSTSRLSNGVTSPQVNDAAPENFGSKLKKRVSFDKDTTGGENGTLNSETGAMVPVEKDGSGASPSGTLSPAEPATNGLSTVPEDRESENVTAPRPVKDKNDPKPGEYWMRPSYEEIAKMPREQTSQFRGLQVGRQGCGFVTFDGAVDLKSLPPQDALFGPIINISVRSITVYPESSVKPPMGKGLNVPSTLTIENSWPRARGKPEALSSGPLFEKHLKRLKNIGNTKFVSYDVNTGVWVFKVDHYTTYGLDYDDEEDGFGTSQLSAPPDSIKAPDSSVMEVDSDHTSDFGEDDTFHGKQLLTVPGGFGKRSAIDSGDNSIVKSIEYDSPRSEHSNFSEDEASDNERPDMAGSYPDLPVTEAAPQLPHLQPGTPGRPLLDIDLEGDWAEQLQRTISPRKQDRNALREAQNKILLDREYSPIKPGTIGKKGFGTSIDIMHSLFDKRGGQMDSAGFEFPYAKRSKTFDPNDNEMSDTDKAWHASFKPHFTSEGKLIVKSRTAAANDRVWEGTAIARSHNRTIVLNELKPHEQLNMNDLTKNAAIELSESGIPQVEYNALPFSTHAASLSSTASSSEARLYELLHLLFDDYEDNYTSGLSDVQRGEFGDRIRKDRLSAFLSHLIAQKDKTTLTMLEMRNPVEAALRWLVRGDAIKASDLLYKSRNPTMALLVAQAPNAGEEFQSAVAEQINNWREQSALSEIDLHIRALYELLAGNTTVSEGVEGTTLEHKAATFAISDLLGLDWLNMFALNLWYGTHKTGTIEDIVAVFDSLLSSGEETASPVLPGGHQDPLWVALKIYASTITTTANNVVLKCPIIPQSLSALAAPYSGFDSLALFRTHHALATSLPALDVQIDIDEDAADQLAADLAMECEMRGDVAGAVWATLHIDEEQVRGRAVVEVLLRNAARLPVPSPLPLTLDGSNGSEEWNVLTKALAVPETWIYQALALLKRAEGGGDAAEEELAYLVKAEEMEQAHQCFVERVAPVLVVDGDWEGLEQMLGLFGAEQGKPEGWREGGGVFEDFLRLVNMKEKAVVGEEDSNEVLVGRLARSLAAMAKDVEGQERKLGEAVDEGIVLVRRRVAVREMARMVVELAGVGVGDGDGDSAGMRDVLMELPLTSEIKTRLGRQMAREYYGKIMSGRAS